MRHRMGRLPRVALLCALSVVAGSAANSAGEPAGPALCGEFAVGKDGRLILLPVALNGDTLQCLLDTGASRSGFDVTLKGELGEVQGTLALQTPAGRRRFETFKWPDASLHEQPLATDRLVVCLDLSDARHATNEQIRGVIGMDVLRKCRLQIDFDRGRLRFLANLPENRDELGQRIPIRFRDDGSPFVVGSINNGEIEQFLIDTGAQGNSLDADVFDDLLKKDVIRLGSSSASLTVAGAVRGDRGRLGELRLASFTHQGLRFSRLNVSSLGIRYFSRFAVTFDFPGRCVYLQKGVAFARSEPSATSGLVLNWIDGETVVESVRNDGPAAVAGIKAHDVLVRIDEQPAGEYDPFTLRQLLTSRGGKRIAMTVRRGNRAVEVVVELAAD